MPRLEVFARQIAGCCRFGVGRERTRAKFTIGEGASMRFTGILALAAFACTSGIAAAASFTYNVNDVFSNFSVMGTITTDTDSGVLATSDITAWDLTLNDGTKILVINPG